MNWLMVIIIFNGGPNMYQINFDSKDHCEKSRPIIERMVMELGYHTKTKCIQVKSDVFNQDFDNRPMNRK